MSRFQVHVAAPLHPAGWEILHHAADILICDSQTPTEFDAILVGPSIPVGQKLIENSSRLKVIACLGAQLEAIDLDFATRMGILVVHAPATAASAVVEYTFALLLALARRVPQGAEAIREGRIPTEDLPGFQLTRKTLGIIGLGRIGRQVAVLAQAFGMHVVAYDPYIQLSRAHSQSIEMISFPELLARSDIITLHPAMTQETRGMLNQAAFELVNPGAILINCTHADLIDEIALLNALDSGRVAAAALDAFSPEPHAREHPLLQHPRVLATPHFNQNTSEAQASTSQQVVRDMLSALRDEDFNNIANLPFSDSIPYRLARPYIQLAARLGRLQGQLAGGRITRLEVELLGGIGASETSLQELVRPLTAMLLSGMLRPVSGRKPNWVSAPVLAYEQGITMAQINGLVRLDDYPNLIACRIYWETGHRTVAGVLFGNGEARLVQYDRFQVDAYPDGYVLILENEDVPGVIGKVGTRLGNAGINIAQWRYGRDHPGGKAVSFINLDSRPEQGILNELEQEPEIYRARLVRL